MLGKKLPTGVAGLDEVLLGGLVEARSYLLVGHGGAGKTVLALQWLLEGVKRGERCLYITLAEASYEIKQNAASFGWDLTPLEMVDLSPTGEALQRDEGEYHVFAPSEVEQGPLWRTIFQVVQEQQPQRLVMDSITQLRYLSTDEYQFRKNILALVSFLNRSGCTSLLTFEPGEMERETSVALAVNGIVHLRSEVSQGRAIGLRSIQIEKLRGSPFISGLHPMRITSRGVAVYPHHVETPQETQPGRTMTRSGLAALDALLGGGIESGTTTILSGPSGVGKSTLAAQFLEEAGRHAERGVFYTFEESINSVLNRNRGIGGELARLVAEGVVKIVRVNPMELYPDEFLCRVRDDVQRDRRQLVVVDSLRGYQMAMEEFGSLVSHVHNLVTYLNRQEVTTFLVNEVETITGDLRVTEVGVSHLADNVLLLRYAEHAGRLIKLIGCLKKRLGGFEPQLRQMEITPQGVQIGEPLETLHGLLTGVPELVTPVERGI